MKLRTKIPTLLIPLTVVPLLVLGWIAYDELREASEQRVFGEMRASVDRVAVHMNTEINTAISNIELFAKHILVKKYVLTEDEDQRYTLMLPPLLRLFKTYQEAFPDYYEIRVLMADGYEDARHTHPHIDNKTEQEADNPVFQKLSRSGENIFTSIYSNPDNDATSLFVGKPLLLRDPLLDAVDAPPALRGYLALTVKLQDFSDQIARGAIGRKGYLFATDAEGNVLFQGDSAVLGGNATMGMVDKVVNVDGLPMKMRFNGRMSFLHKTSLYPDLYLFAVMPEDELLAISHDLAAVVAAITLVTILVTMVCLFAALEYLVINPIHRLRNLSKQIGRGEWAASSGVNSRDEIGELATSFEDMASNLKRSDEQVRYLAYHDSLTGLPNRTMFNEYLGHAIARARRNREMLSVLFVDIDDFKRVNDTLGHHAGDALLQEVAERLSHCLRDSDYIAIADHPDRPAGVLARQGGDEFIILLPGIKDVHDPSIVAHRIIKCLTRPITIQEHECYTSASIGITVYPTDGDQSEELIKNADVAMYHAKERGKNRCQYFKDSMNVAAFARLGLETRLRKALENDELTLYYQRQVNATNGEVVGLEALLRWQDAEDGFVSPNVFIPLAEQTGLILPIGAWVLNEACRQARAWQDAGYPPAQVSVNVSSVQFAREDVARTVRRALADNDLDPSCLEIEITESTIMANPKGAVEILANIRALGVRIALDDFGTGYSSLNYLRRFPIDTLKIDRSFIIDIDENPEDEKIVAAIVALAHALGLRVVVEGVETPGQLRVVVDKGCDVIQGFLFSHPLPAAQAIHQLARRKIA